MRTRGSARTHRVFKLWKNPNGLIGDARRGARPERVKNIAANKSRKKAGAERRPDAISRSDFGNAVTQPTPKIMTRSGLADGARLDHPGAENAGEFSVCRKFAI